MKSEIHEECLRVNILLASPLLATVTVFKQTLPGEKHYFNDAVYLNRAPRERVLTRCFSAGPQRILRLV